MQKYNVFYHENIGEIRVVYEGLDAPKDFERVDMIEHDSANQSAQQLKMKAINVVSKKFSTADVNINKDVKIYDQEPRGYIVTEESEKLLHPENFDDPEVAKQEATEKQDEEIDPEIGNQPSPGTKLTNENQERVERQEGLDVTETQPGEVSDGEPKADTPEKTDTKEVVITSNLNTDLKVGESFRIESSTEDDLAYESSRKEVATVTKAGLVKAVSVGEAVIRTALKDNMDTYTDTNVRVTE